MGTLTRRSFFGVAVVGTLQRAGRGAALTTAQMWSSSSDRLQRMSGPSTVQFTDRDRAGTAKPDEPNVITVNPDRVHQSILGFGSSLEPATCWNLSLVDPAKRERVIDRIVSPIHGIGMNLMRICIGTPDFTGDPWYSYDDLQQGETDPELTRFSIEKDRSYILPVLKLALVRNPSLLYFASPWSPPGWMKTTGTMAGGSLLPQWYPTYAEYFVRFLKAYAAEGVPVYAVTIQNEPGVDRAKEKDRRWHYPSCHWTAEQERDFIRDHLGPALRRNGLKTRVWCYDHNYNEIPSGDDPGIAYPRTILSDEGAAQFVDGVAFHGYAGRPSGMSAFKREFPRVPVYFTEGSVFGVRGGLQLIERLRNQASSYNAWVTMLDDNRKPNNGPFPASRTILTLNPTTLEVNEQFDFDLYGHFMKFIARSAVRLESSEGDRQTANVTFRNPDGTVVLVVVNAGSADRSFLIRCGERQASVSLRAASVATLAWKGD